MKRLRFFLYAGPVVAVFAGVVSLLYGNDAKLVTYIMEVVTAFGVIVLLVGLFATNVEADAESAENKSVISKASSALDSKLGDGVKPAWDLARGTLDTYWKQNLRQNQLIYVASVFATIAGFGMFIYGLHSNSSSIALVTLGAGTVTQFIGATFLIIYRSTLNQAVKFNDTLERINSVGMSWYIIESMETSTAQSRLLKNKIKGALALQIGTLSNSTFQSLINPEHDDGSKTENGAVGKGAEKEKDD